MTRHRPILYAVAYVLFLSGIFTGAALAYLDLAGIPAEQAATALLVLGVLGTFVLQPWERRETVPDIAGAPQHSPTPSISITQVLNFGMICACLALWNLVVLLLLVASPQ